MAATLTSDQDELVHFSFPIEKREDTATINPVDGTPDILITGKATDGTIDGDREIVDPEWSAKAIQEWCDTGGNVRMSHDPRRPVGKGQHVQVTTDGHYVTSLIADPLCKHFIRTGVLNDYSVGITMPDFRYRDQKLDPHGKAVRVITGRPDGLSRIAELSVVDRGSNFNSRFQIVRKSAGNGDGDEFVGKMVGDEDEIAKAAPAMLTKAAADDDFVNVDLPKGASISISPADFAALKTFKQQLTVKAAGATLEADTEKRDVGAAERRDLASEHHALPDGSYPIDNTGDLHNAAVLARSGHGDVAAARRLIARRAGELGVANPLDESDAATKAETIEAPDVALKEAEPDVIKDPESEAKDKPVKKAKKKKKLPPWLNKPGADGKGDDDSCKQDHAHTEKCKTTPAEAAGLSGTHDMNPAPVPELMESPPMASTKGGPTPASAGSATGEHMTPVPAHREPDGALNDSMEADAGMSDGDHETPTRLEAAMKGTDPEVAVLLRFKTIGVDEDLGRLHDLTCPAFHPEDVAKFHPYADLPGLIDSGAWQRKTLAAAAGPLEHALKGQEIWQAALLLKTADMADLNDFRLELHKAFRDANPGPSSYPTPGMVMPGRYNRPVLTDGRGANGVDYAGPNSAPQIATGTPNAQHFDRPPLSSMQESPSPSFMKGGGAAYPSEQGVPMQLSYAQMQKEQARQALVRMHEHLSRQFPEACPMSLDAPARQPEGHPVPQAAGIGKAIDPEPAPAQAAPVAAVFKAPAEEESQFMDAEIWKGFKKQRKKLGKKVLAGEMTVDEARAKMGRQFAQKGSDEQPEPTMPVQKGTVTAVSSTVPGAQVVYATGGGGGGSSAIHYGGGGGGGEWQTQITRKLTADIDPEVIKSAVAEALSPLAAELTSTKALLAEQQETFTTKLAEQQRVIDAIADQPDPSTAAFSGLAFNPVQKTARPAGVTDVAEAAERAQAMIRRNLQTTYYNHSSPAVREAAGQELAKLGWENPMT